MSNSRRPSIFADVSPPGTSFYSDVPKDAINLGIESYRGENGKSWSLPVVHYVEKQLANDESSENEYLDNPAGFEPFVDLSCRLIFGPAYNCYKDKIAAIQTVSATGALRLGFEFMARVLDCNNVWLGSPSWADYGIIATSGGIFAIHEYPYWSFEQRTLTFNEMYHALSQAETNSIVVLQCGHNPTGIDPQIGQWRKLAELIKDNNLIPFFDVANIGLFSGSAEDDAAPIRIFAEMGIEFFVAQSFSKNFGLYNERVGNLIVVSQDPSKVSEIKQYLCNISRSLWTNPPTHGAKIVYNVLKTNYHKQQWNVEIQMIYKRTQKIRRRLRDLLEQKQTPGTWKHITDSSGLYTCLGLNEHQLIYLSKKHNVYTGVHGRINISMINEDNIEEIVSAIDDAARQA